MLFKTSLVLLAVWLFGVVGPYDLGDVVHLLLLVGLMLALVTILRALDAGTRHPPDPDDKP